jgi:Zn-dependent peptidase ImmA (M78 family)
VHAAGRPLVLLNPAKRDAYRQRFDVAHELGHLVMHLDAEPGTRRAEEQANRFAAEFLMPAARIREELPSRADWRALAGLRERWGTSMAALLYRARTLGTIREVTYRNAMSTMSAKGWRRREPGPPGLMEHPSLLPRAVDLLGQTGLTAQALAAQCRVPLDLFATVTSPTPQPTI